MSPAVEVSGFVIEDAGEGLRVVQINHAKAQNPFTRAMTRTLTEIAEALERDDEVAAVVLTGGEGRSFSVGGDFREVIEVDSAEAVAGWLGEIIDLYIALLSLSKPVVAAIDHFAIGQGLQVALQTDWKLVSARAKLAMPELRNGVACPLGATILEGLLGRAAMLRLVIGCERLDAEQSRAVGLVDEVVPEAELRARALARARSFAAYPAVAYRTTKRIHNAPAVAALDGVREAAITAHWSCCQARSGDAHINTILGRSG